MQKFESPYFAAIDLGSNSFHMLISRFDNDHLETVDKVKDMVQLASGLQKDGSLDVATQDKALACLARFSERIQDIPSNQVRVVGTRTLRAASDSQAFIAKAEATLGHPIEIISGYEEARLIYEGIAHSLKDDHQKRLIIDIGGGSTEFVIGCDEKPRLLESLGLGCVSYTDRFDLRDGLDQVKANISYIIACANVEKIRTPYIEEGWDIVYGTSGTMKAIADILKSDDGGAVITISSLKALRQRLIEGDIDLRKFNLPKPRQEVLPAGVVILCAIMDQLEIDRIQVADATLKEGLVYDVVGRLSDSDLRNITIEKLQNQYNIDIKQADRVKQTALELWGQISPQLSDDLKLPASSRTKILRWACMVHEIGLTVSHSGHHNHSYYLLRHADLAGFSRYEQYFLANLVRAQRKQLNRERFQGIEEKALNALIPLVLCLRISVLLHRHRGDIDFIPKIRWNNGNYTLRFPVGWLEEHPLTMTSCEQEAQYFSTLGLMLHCH